MPAIYEVLKYQVTLILYGCKKLFVKKLDKHIHKVLLLYSSLLLKY